MPMTHILAFTLGLFSLQVLRELPQPAWLLLLAVPALFPWRFRSQLAMFVLGLLLMFWHAQSVLDQRWPVSRHDDQVWVQGHVASLPDLSLAPQRYSRSGELRAEESPQIWRFLFEPESSEFPQKIRVSWYRTPEQVKGGECWRFRLRMKTPHGSLNPGAFDYEAWLFRQGIAATGIVREAQRCAGQDAQVRRGDRDVALRAADDANDYRVLRLRQSLIDQLKAWLPEHPALGLVVALTVGDPSMLHSADWQVFRLTGTTHLVAISGFNIAIIAGVAFVIFRWLWVLWPPLCLRLPAQKAGMMGAAVSALLYALLAGFEPPVMRAVIMLWIILAAAWAHRLSQSARVLALAWFVILLLGPFAIMAPGLWLSFGAVAAIFYLSAGRLVPRGMLPLLVLLQLMLSVVMTPLTLYFFNGASWCAPLVNLLAVPLLTVLTPLLLLALVLAGLWPETGVPALTGTAELLQHLRDALGWAATHVPQMWIPASPPAPALLLALLGSVLLFTPRGLPLKPLAILCFLPLLFPPNTAPKQGFELTVLDVGQGLSSVIRTANHTLVFDAGPAFDEGFDAGSSIVAPYLLNAGVRRIDRLLISHADNDHSGGASALRSLLNIESELGALTRTPCRQGQEWQWDGVRFQVLHPDGDGDASDNNGSCVLRVSIGTQAVLLPADIEKVAERQLLRERPQDLRAQVLVAPHHGSKTSSTAEFIAAVDAHTVIFSAGWKHHFHHPHPSVVERYALSGAQLYDTGWTGALTLQVNADGISEVRGWREQANRYWNAQTAEMPPEP